MCRETGITLRCTTKTGCDVNLPHTTPCPLRSLREVTAQYCRPPQSAPHHNRVRWLQLLGGAAITSYISYAFSIHIRQFFITCHCAADTSPSSAFTLKYRKSIKRSQITAVCKQNISGTPNSRIHSAHRQPGQNHLNTARRIASPGVE